MRRKKEELEIDRETLEHKTLKCPLLSEGDGWERLAKVCKLSLLLHYEQTVSRWCRDPKKVKKEPICDWIRGKLSTTDMILKSKKKSNKEN